MGDYHEHQHQEMFSKEMMILKDLVPKASFPVLPKTLNCFQIQSSFILLCFTCEHLFSLLKQPETQFLFCKPA